LLTHGAIRSTIRRVTTTIGCRSAADALLHRVEDASQVEDTFGPHPFTSIAVGTGTHQQRLTADIEFDLDVRSLTSLTISRQVITLREYCPPCRSDITENE
jgi:hypothetical protein